MRPLTRRWLVENSGVRATGTSFVFDSHAAAPPPTSRDGLLRPAALAIWCVALAEFRFKRRAGLSGASMPFVSASRQCCEPPVEPRLLLPPGAPLPCVMPRLFWV